MKRLLALLSILPIFAIAACGNLEFVIGTSANANVGGDSGSGGGSAECQCSDGTKDGSRLKARYLIGEDGSRVQLPEWFDTELGDTCQFQSFDNGDIRCVPSAPVLNSYVDPGCTIPVIVLKDPCLDAPKYAMIEEFSGGDACSGPKLEHFTIVKFDTSNDLKGVTNTYYITPNGQCDPAGGVPIGSGWRLYPTYPLHDSTWFVKAAQDNNP